VYCDTSTLVAAFAREANDTAVRATFTRNGVDRPVVSDWNLTEFSAAISFKLNLGAITASDVSVIFQLFIRARETLFQLVPVSSADFRLAASYADRFETRLRSGDALHLAIATNNRQPIFTLDKRMISAAKFLNIETIELQ
jgi:uncharacterized protein